MDDGSKNVEMSLEMIKMLRAQGVERIAATSHFYAHREDGNIENYLRKRQYAYESLMAQSPVIDKLSNVDLNTLTPIEAMNLLYELKNML